MLRLWVQIPLLLSFTSGVSCIGSRKKGHLLTWRVIKRVHTFAAWCKKLNKLRLPVALPG